MTSRAGHRNCRALFRTLVVFYASLPGAMGVGTKPHAKACQIRIFARHPRTRTMCTSAELSTGTRKIPRESVCALYVEREPGEAAVMLILRATLRDLHTHP